MEDLIQPLLICFLLPIGAAAQAVPAASWKPQVPVPAGTLNYTIRYSQTAQISQQLGNWQSLFLSGDLTYENGSGRLPFSLSYGGGYGWSIGGPSYNDGLFQHMLVSQGLEGHLWSASVSDDVSYTPQAPTFGFSGVAGTGEPIAGQGPPSSLPMQSILTLNTNALENTVIGQFSRELNSSIRLDLGASYDILQFPNGNGLNTNSEAANGGFTWRLDARDSITSVYQFTQFTYNGLNVSLQTQSAMFGGQRAWTRNISTNISAGPEWVSSNSSSVLPSSTLLAVNASFQYQMHQGSFGLNYSRGVSGGAGYMLGADVDSVSANYTLNIGRSLNMGLFGAYSRTVALQNSASLPSQLGLINGTVTSELGGAQVSRTFGRYWSVFGNYSAISQGASATVPGNTLNELIQTFGFGVGFTPKPLRLHSAR